jgi:hypothetical protein
MASSSSASSSSVPNLETNLGLVSSLLAIDSNSYEEPVQILWNGVLSTWFPYSEGYKWAIKGPVVDNNTMPDAAVFEIRAFNRNLNERQIFMVECKRPSLDTTAGWRDAFDQLDRYLSGNLNGNDTMFGAIGIGKKVILTRWTRAPQNGRPTWVHPSGTGNPLLFDLSDQQHRASFAQWMSYIKEHAWDLIL